MTINQMYLILGVGIVLTIVLLYLGITLNKKWLRNLSLIPAVVSAIPFIQLLLLLE